MNVVDTATGEIMETDTLNYEVHPVAAIFPFIEGAAFDEFVEDIRVNGQREPVVLDSAGRLLDGRNRARACQVLGIDVRESRYSGSDATGWIISHNVHRRHLSASQRAMVAARLATLQHGTNRYEQKVDGSFDPSTKDPRTSQTVQNAADALNVGTASVKRAKAVIASGDADLIHAVESGEVPVTKAAKQVISKKRHLRAVQQSAGRDREGKTDIIRELAAKGYTSEQMCGPTGYVNPETVRRAAADAGIDIPADAVMRRKRRRDHMRILDNITDSLEVAAMSLRDIDPAQLDEDEALERLDSLTASISALAKATKKIKESFRG